jgi:PAS domain S-box-containing protein
MYVQRDRLPLNPGEGKDNDAIRLLNQAIDSFNGAASKFETYYQHLENRVRELDIELKNKNEALEISLKEKEKVKCHLHNILESVTTGVVVVDLKGRVTTFNTAAENITGFFSGEVREKRIDKIFPPNFFQNSNFEVSLLEDIQENTAFEAEIHRRGRSILHVSLTISPLKNPRGEKEGIVLTLQDISRMKKLEEQTNLTGRLAAMGEMAVKIAHEIRNPLGSIELFATALRKDLENNGDLKLAAEHISSGVRSINNIISNLLLFIRPQQKPALQAIDIQNFLSDSLFFSSHLIETNDGIDIITNYSHEPLMVLGDSELLKQMCLNLILNAIQAMPDGGSLTISTRKAKGDKRDSDIAEIRFVDTGIGIPRKDMFRIFDPFFTTKKRGTGLGLAIVHNIIKLHEGTIDINSTEEGGVVCTVALPLWKGQINKNGV